MKLSEIEQNAILRTSLDFAVATVAFCEALDTKKKFVVSNQLLRSGTSIGANAMEAQNAESKSDFIHKMKIAAKEAVETQYWLLLCERANLGDTTELQGQLETINRILTSIIGTAKRKSPISYFLHLFL